MAKTSHSADSLAIDASTAKQNQALSSKWEFERLIRELAVGSEEAAWKLAEVYTPHILRVVRSALPNVIRRRMDSIDFAQIVWASILQRRSYLTNIESPERLIALLSTIARRKVTDAFRHNTYQVRDVRRESTFDMADLEYRAARGGIEKHDLTDQDPTPSQLVGLKERWAGVIGALSPRDRMIVRLRIQGLKFSDIAERADVCESTAKRVMDRVFEELQS